eukprot:GHVT01062615.1.p2 GENE.GHVT01062615.1~~GHVT01062615.1.p2  ORF type:complete len:155 (+),score=32.76 GHVT01062615.1:2273-2737(+)
MQWPQGALAAWAAGRRSHRKGGDRTVHGESDPWESQATGQSPTLLRIKENVKAENEEERKAEGERNKKNKRREKEFKRVRASLTDATAQGAKGGSMKRILTPFARQKTNQSSQVGKRFVGPLGERSNKAIKKRKAQPAEEHPMQHEQRYQWEQQ